LASLFQARFLAVSYFTAVRQVALGAVEVVAIPFA